MNGCSSTKRRTCAVAALVGSGFAVFVGALPSSAEAAEFEVSSGHLSASVRDIVESYGWSLVWAADEDRVVDYPFAIGNGSLREALTDLLVVYRGQFVADLYEGNRVVLIDSAPPRIRVVLPGTASASDQVAAVARSRVAAGTVGASSAVVDGADTSTGAAAPVETGEFPQPTESRESADLPVNAGTPEMDLASRPFVGE